MTGGSTAPTDVTGVTATFTIPLTSVAVGSSTYFPVFHYMGEKAAIRLYTSGTMYSDDACIQKQADDSYTKLNPAAWPASLHFDGAKYVLKTADVTSGTCTNCTCSNLAVTNSTPYHTCSSCTCADVTPTATDIEALNIEATFTGSSGWGYSHKNEILISDTTEEGFDAVAQWSEYIAAFFNRETEVSGLEVYRYRYRYRYICISVYAYLHTYGVYRRFLQSRDRGVRPRGMYLCMYVSTNVCEYAYTLIYIYFHI